jgi:hypothetical protein
MDAMVETRTVSTWGAQVQLQVKVFGTGPALIYLYPLGGVRPGFLDELARTHTIYAAELPGTSVDDTFAIHNVNDIFDLVLVYEEALRSAARTDAARKCGPYPRLFSWAQEEDCLPYLCRAPQRQTVAGALWGWLVVPWLAADSS